MELLMPYLIILCFSFSLISSLASLAIDDSENVPPKTGKVLSAPVSDLPATPTSPGAGHNPFVTPPLPSSPTTKEAVDPLSLSPHHKANP